MRITIAHGFFLPIPPAAGGAMEKMWWTLARDFAARGHEVVSFSRRWPGWPDDELREGVRCLRRPGFAHTRRLPLNLLLDALWGLRALRHLPPADILVTNTVLLPALASRLHPRAGRVVVSLNRMPKGQLRTYGRIARLQVPSSAVAAAAVATVPELASRIKIFPNVIDYAALRSAGETARAPSPAAPLRIGYIGRLHPEKGLRLLISAALRLAARADLPPWTLSLRGPLDIPRGGGGDVFGAELHDQAAPLLAAGKLEFLPAEFSPPALAAAYAGLDLFTYPSLAERGETFGVSVAEAMAAGAVPVVSDLPCFTDLVTDGVNGLVFPRAAPDPAAALSDRLAALLLDPARRQSLANAAQSSAARCAAPAIATAMLTDFTTLLP
jgi:glycosyltransferase involved in cell wall biosynthesis